MQLKYGTGSPEYYCAGLGRVLHCRCRNVNAASDWLIGLCEDGLKGQLRPTLNELGICHHGSSGFAHFMNTVRSLAFTYSDRSTYLLLW